MGHRGLAATAGTLLFVAIAPAAARATTGVGSAPGEPSPAASGRGFGPTHDAGPSGPSAVAAPAPPGDADPYFPLEGNGGYDVRHYDLTFSYDPATDRLDAVNAIRAVATQKLSRFDLDLQQLDVSAVTVNATPTTTASRSASRWRRRRGRCTRTCAASRRSPTSWPTNGSATASR
jgi:hypothetical protein